ncbi:MAG TPA: thioredoxin family protein, partial [Pirellulales bacterium]
GFFKGVVATLLATPCSGPFVGSVLGATLTMPVSEIYLVFAAVGLGMASPYLVIGVFPKLVSFLPKPGAWMETFKQAMGFMLMGGVIFLVNSLPSDYFIPTFTFLIGLWAAVWWIGRTDPTADFSTTARAWMVAGTIVLLVSAASFGMLIPGKDLPWKPFTKEALAQYQAEGKTVLVDFTADWCTNCKAIEKFVLNTWWTSKVVDANGVITLKADMTEESEEIQSMLNSLGSTSIPVTAIFPADRPNEPLVIRDIYTSWTLLDALNEAGPSKNVAAPAAAPNGVAPATPASETALAPVPAEPGVMR